MPTTALIFYVLAALAAACTLGVALIRQTRKAATIAAVSMGLLAVLAVILAERPIALALAFLGGLALVFLSRSDEVGEAPHENRSYFAGLVSVLFFVIGYRVIAGSAWGTQDYSKTVSTALSVPDLSLVALAALLLLIVGLSAWSLRRGPAL